MFEASRTRVEGLDQLLIRSSRGDEMDIALGRGARLNHLAFKGDAVIAGEKTPAGIQQDIWAKSALLFPFPNRLADGQYQFQGKAYQFPVNEKPRNNALHGFLDALPFQLKDARLSADTATITAVHVYQGERAYYPFPCHVEVTYELARDNTLTLLFTVKNTGESSMPVGFGWHPYFDLGSTREATYLKLPAVKRIETDHRAIPTGKHIPDSDFAALTAIPPTELDHCFQWQSGTTKNQVLISDGQGKVLTVDSGPNTAYWQIFTPPFDEVIALEPMSCNINAFQNQQGLVVLNVGETFRTEIRVAYSATGI